MKYSQYSWLFQSLPRINFNCYGFEVFVVWWGQDFQSLPRINFNCYTKSLNRASDCQFFQSLPRINFNCYEGGSVFSYLSKIFQSLPRINFNCYPLRLPRCLAGFLSFNPYQGLTSIVTRWVPLLWNLYGLSIPTKD